MRLKNFKDEVIAQLDMVSNTKYLNPNQEKAKEFIIKDINKYFFKQIEVINAHFYNKLKIDIFAKENTLFWDKVKARWGKGNGYRTDMVKFYRENINDKGLNKSINKDIEIMSSNFKSGIIDILKNL